MPPSPLEREIAEALAHQAYEDGYGGGPHPAPTDENRRQAEAVLSVLLPHLERCREALRPFAAAAEHITTSPESNTALLTARSALRDLDKLIGDE